jgi:large exoprotein involved in heme utilization and adhesion
MLQVPEGQSVSLVGGDITVQAGTASDGTIQTSSLRAPGGQINLVSVASPGEVLVPSVQIGSFTTMGTVIIKEGLTLDVSGQDEVGTPIGNGNNGTVLVRGGQLVMDASTILVLTEGAVAGAATAVDIQVSHDVILTNVSQIATLSFGPGRPGNVQLTAGTLTMENFSSIVTATVDEGGVGGDVDLNVGTVRLMGGSSIQSLSQNFTPGLGQGGNVTIQGLPGAEFGAAESVTLSGGSSLLSQTNGSGDGGRVAITTKSLMMEGGSSVSTTAGDVGRGGDIVLGVRHARLSGGAIITTQTFSSDVNPVEGGTVTLQGWQGSGSMADSVILSGPGTGIISDTLGTGRSGDVAVHAKTVSLTNGAVILSGTPFTTAAGGNVTIDAGSVGISGGSHVSSQSSSLDAGQVTITANALTLDKGSIETNTNGFGNGGDVVLNVGTVSLSNGATINSSSVGFEADAGNAGNVTITSSGAFISNASTITTAAQNARAGAIDLTAQRVALLNGATITTSSSSPLLPDGGGNAGNLTIHSGSIVVMNNSLMTADASQAGGGKITITAPEMVWLINSRISTSVGGSLTDFGQGDITIDPQFVILQNSQILSQAFGGGSGNVIVIADVLLVDPNSILSASGSIRITAPSSLPVSEVLMPLSQEFSSAANLLLAQRCAADPTGQFSSFVQTGREGVPQIPGALSPSPLSFLETLTSSSLGSPSPNGATARLGLGSVRYDDATRFLSACRS